jgi:hypothetical protein
MIRLRRHVFTTRRDRGRLVAPYSRPARGNTSGWHSLRRLPPSAAFPACALRQGLNETGFATSTSASNTLRGLATNALHLAAVAAPAAEVIASGGRKNPTRLPFVQSNVMIGRQT